MTLYIMTLHWNNVEKLKKLHKTLIPNLEQLNIDWQWWIKDNGSTDGSKEFLQSIESNKIKIHFRNHNKDSFSSGMNLLFELINPNDEDYILLLNNDLWFNDKNSIKNMISLFNKDVGIVGARILYPNSNLLQHAGIYFSKKYNYYPYHYRHGEKDNNESRQTKEVESVTGACLLTKAGYYRNTGNINKSGRKGLSETLFWAFEDIDYNLTIKYNLGKKIIYCGKTEIFHEESATLKKNNIHKMFMPNNFKIFKEKWFGKYKKYD